MKLLGEHVYRVGEIEIDTSLGCITRNGEEQYLRQKAFQLLLYLLERRQRLVTKEELFEDIWEGTAVSDDALVQLIKDVRKALGDDPRQPQFIKTVPKVGYRFIGPVEELIAGGPAIVETKEITTVEVEYEEEDATDNRLVETGRRALPGSRSRQGIGRRLVMIFASLAIAAIALAIYLRPVKPSLPEMTLPQVAGKKSIAVMHFENLSASRELDWLREGLADMLITNLGRSAGLTVLSRQQLHLLLERLEHNRSVEIQLSDALEIAKASRAEVVILGSFANVGDSMHISVQLYDARRNEALAYEQIEIEKPKDIIAQVDLLSLKLAARLGVSTEAQEAKRGLAEAMTNNLEAYRCYSLAVEKAYGLQSADAIALLEKSVSLDPQFAMAYARIGYTYAVRWSFGEKARPYLERAFQLSDRLTEKDRLHIAAWYAVANFDNPGAIRSFQELVERYPLEVEAYWRLSASLQEAERLDEALDAAKRGLAVDPEAKELYNQLGGVYLDLYRHDEAIEMYQRYLALAPDEPNAHDSMGLVYQAVGRYDEAAQSYRRALSLAPDFVVPLIHLANVCFQQGRYHEAINVFKKTIRVAPSEAELMRGYNGLIEVYLRKGETNRAEAVAGKETGLRKPWHSLVIASRRGDAATVKKLREQLLAKPAFADKIAREPLRSEYYFRAFLELNSGQTAEAIKNFKEALKHRPLIWNIDSYEDCLAGAFLELGMLDEAIAEYERVLRLNPNYPLAHYHLAQAFERRGDAERARSEYRQFLEVWKGADSDIPEVIAANICWARILNRVAAR